MKKVINVNMSIMGDFLNGQAVMKIANPQELYIAMSLFRHTTYNFFNMNLMDDARLLAVTGSRNPKYMDVSRDIDVREVHGIPADMVTTTKLLQRAVYYNLRDFYNFHGFPVYLHVRNTWNDDLYGLKNAIVQEMNTPPELHKQIELLYENNGQLYVLNEFNPNVLCKSPRIENSPWKVMVPQAGGDTDEYRPAMLANTINVDISYPICVIDQCVTLLKYIMERFSDTQIRIQTNTLELFDMMRIIMVVDDPYMGSNELSENLYDKFRGFMCFGNPVMEIESASDLADLATIFSFFTKGNPVALEIPDTDGPYWLKYDTKWEMPTFIDKPVDDTIVVRYKDIVGFIKEMTERYMFILNLSKPLLMSLPLYNAVIPPNFVHSIRDIMYKEMSGEN
jgi:hypothetical protein